MILSTFTAYSPTTDSDLTRVSVADDRGAEFFAFIEAGLGKSYRERKEAAVAAIVQYIEDGGEPGEVAL